MINFEVTSTIYSLETFNHQQIPLNIVQPIGLLDTTTNYLWKVDDFEDDTVFTKFYFFFPQDLQENKEEDINVPIKNNDDVVLLAYHRNWYNVVIKNSKIEYIKINKNTDLQKIYIQCDEKLCIGVHAKINSKKVKIVLPSGITYEQGGEAYLAINQTKSTRNVLVIISVVVLCLWIFLYHLLIKFEYDFYVYNINSLVQNIQKTVHECCFLSKKSNFLQLV